MKGNKIGKYLLISFFIVIGCVVSSQAQYPFEKYKAITYTRAVFRSYYNKDKSYMYYYTELPTINTSSDKYSIVVECKTDWSIANIYTKRNGKIIQKFYEEWGMPNSVRLKYLFIADINGDGLKDIKFSANNIGNNFLALARERVYLFQDSIGHFKKVSFSDDDASVIYQENWWNLDNNWPERDFNNDGNYEIITCHLVDYKHHSYWSFDLYNYDNGKLVCMDDKYDYPIMVQYLIRKNYEITKNISRDKMKTFKQLLPVGD